MASLWWKRGVPYLRPRGGKPMCLRGLSDDDARRMLAEYQHREATARRHDVLGLAPGLLPLDEVIRRWLADRAERRGVDTVRRYRSHAAQVTRLGLGALRVADVTSADVRRYLATRARESSRQNADKDRGMLRQVWRWARRQVPPLVGESNPVEAVDPFGDAQTPRAPCTAELHTECLAALRETATGAARADLRYVAALAADVVAVIWWTGWRIGETCRLRVGDVDLEGRTVVMRSARNKGGEVLWPLPDEVMPLVAARCAGRPKDAPLFAPYPRAVRSATRTRKPAATALVTLTKFRQRWTAPPERRHLRAAFFHALRHAYATDLGAAGVGTVTSRHLTRHRSLSQLARYSHAQLEAMRAGQEQLAASRLERSRRRPPPSAPPARRGRRRRP